MDSFDFLDWLCDDGVEHELVIAPTSTLWLTWATFIKYLVFGFCVQSVSFSILNSQFYEYGPTLFCFLLSFFSYFFRIFFMCDL